MLWEAMHEELRRPRARRVEELAECLARIGSVIAALAVEEPAFEQQPPIPQHGPQPFAPPREPQPPASQQELEIAIHDTRRGCPQASAAPGAEALRALGEPGVEGVDWKSRPPVHPPLDPPAHLPRTGGEDPAAWAGSIEAGLERHADDGLPFAVLLVEVPDVERLAQAEPPEELVRMLEAVERAARPELRPSDTVVRESRGRWWLTASRTNAPGARTLAERLVRIARTVASPRGVPLDLAVGIAVCPADGRDVATLAAHADMGLYAARAAGRAVAPVDDAA